MVSPALCDRRHCVAPYRTIPLQSHRRARNQVNRPLSYQDSLPYKPIRRQTLPLFAFNNSSYLPTRGQLIQGQALLDKQEHTPPRPVAPVQRSQPPAFVEPPHHAAKEARHPGSRFSKAAKVLFSPGGLRKEADLEEANLKKEVAAKEGTETAQPATKSTRHQPHRDNHRDQIFAQAYIGPVLSNSSPVKDAMDARGEETEPRVEKGRGRRALDRINHALYKSKPKKVAFEDSRSSGGASMVAVCFTCY